MLGEDISIDLNDLDNRFSDKNDIDFVDSYYLYKIFDGDKGKKYLEKGLSDINDMKAYLENEVLKEFCNSKYVKLISEEWEKIK